MPIVLPVQESVEVPDPPAMLIELKEQDRLVEFVVATRPTVPVNPFFDEIVIVEVPATPVLTVTDDGLAVLEKSWNV